MKKVYYKKGKKEMISLNNKKKKEKYDVIYYIPQLKTWHGHKNVDYITMRYIVKSSLELGRIGKVRKVENGQICQFQNILLT